MESSKVRRHVRFLLALGKAASEERVRILDNITPKRLEAIREIAIRAIDGRLSPDRRDIRSFQKRHNLLIELASVGTSFTRKKTLVRRHKSFLGLLLRPIYLIRVILDELKSNAISRVSTTDIL